MSATKRMLAASKTQRVFITWPMAGILLAVAGLVILGIMYVPIKTVIGSDGRASFIKAYGKSRPIELRLSGGFLPGAFLPEEQGRGLVDQNELETARSLILDRARSSDDLQSKLWYTRLVLSEKANAKARQHLKELDSRFPDSAEVQNEMGVYLFEDHRIEEAIQRFNRAVELDPRMPEPLFNRAVCYRKLHLLGAATRDFLQAKEIEKDQGWLAEIDARTEEVSNLLTPRQTEEDAASSLEKATDAGDMEEAKRILDQSFEGLWRYSVSILPREYTEAKHKNNTDEAASLLRRMELIGEIILDTKKDSFVQEFCAYLKRIPDSELEIERGLLMDYREVVRRANNLDPSGLALMERVSKESRNRGNFALLALSDMVRALSLLNAGRNTEAIGVLKASLAMIEEHKWPLQRSLMLSQLCNGYLKTGKLSLVTKICNEALDLDLFKDRPTYKAKVLQHLGAAYWTLGNFDKAFRCLQDSTNYYLTAGSAPSRIIQLYQDIAYNYLNIADIHSIKGNHYLALENIEQALGVYTLMKEGAYVAEVFALKATEEASLERFPSAEESLKRAFERVAIEAKSDRYSEKWAQIRAGNIALMKKDWEQAAYYFKLAEQDAIGKDTELHLRIKALQGLSAALTDMKHIEEARNTLDTAIGLIEGYRAGIQESRDRISYLDAVQSIFDQRVSLELEAFQNAENAFDFAERSRARSLLDDLSAKERNGSSTAGTGAINPVRPLRLKELQRQLPPNQIVLMYVVTPRDTFAFVVGREHLNYKKLPLPSDEIERDVKKYRADLLENNKYKDIEALNDKGSNLYRNLIAPVRAWIPNGSNVCIIPDKSLNLPPMAALVDESGRYLMESVTLTNSPSASLLIDSLKKAGEKPAPGDERLLVVANAKHLRGAYPQLQDIPDSQMEAENIRGLYSHDSILLDQDNATEQRVQAVIKDCDVVHFALHVLVEERSPWLAAIVLTAPEKQKTGDAAQPNGAGSDSPPPPGLSLALSKEVSDDPNDGLLSLSEIYNFGLTRTRLVVLSGCQSGLGQYYRGEGMVSLVRPFLASNVPTVLASLWSVNSQATSTLMVDFHKERKKNNLGAGDALRAAQKSMARGQNLDYRHPYYWAPFIVVGGNN